MKETFTIAITCPDVVNQFCKLKDGKLNTKTLKLWCLVKPLLGVQILFWTVYHLFYHHLKHFSIKFLTKFGVFVHYHSLKCHLLWYFAIWCNEIHAFTCSKTFWGHCITILTTFINFRDKTTNKHPSHYYWLIPALALYYKTYFTAPKIEHSKCV